MRYSLSHVGDQVLLRQLSDLVSRDRLTTAEMLAHLAEVEARGLHLRAGFSSMYQYCVGELRLSEDAAAKRIQAARVARKFPAILDALADGQLHLTAVGMLAPHLSSANWRELLEAAGRRTKFELEQLLAERFPKPDLPTLVMAVPVGIAAGPPVPAPIAAPESPSEAPSACENREQHAPAHVHADVHAPRPRVAPLAPERFAIQVTVDQETHDLLRKAQALLGHTVPSGDLAHVLKRALKSLVHEIEKSKYARTENPREGRRSAKARHIPAPVRRAVAKRDGERCTYVSETGRRCEARSRLEFDHVQLFADGGQATVENLRLRFRAHNQYEAECRLGVGFMQGKREKAKRGSISASRSFG